MNNEQLRKEFEAWFLGESPTPTDMKSIEKDAWGGYVLMKTRTDWIAYQLGAKSRDELIGKLCEALGNLHQKASAMGECIDNCFSESELELTNTYLGNTAAELFVANYAAKQALAEAKAQGYGE